MRSHARRNEMITRQEVIQHQQKVQQFFDEFDGPKLSIEFEQLIAAARLFNIQRAESS